MRAVPLLHAGLMTASISWNLIASYSRGTNWYAASLMTALQPWSGNYIVSPMIWATAHTTQVRLMVSVPQPPRRGQPSDDASLAVHGAWLGLPAEWDGSRHWVWPVDAGGQLRDPAEP